jgi:hypothetical protein
MEVPENFRQIITDFTNDLTTTYPEFSFLWSKWTKPQTSDQEFQQLFEFCVATYPERFFDILYQNEEIFQKDAEVEINTTFLPNVEFKLLFHCQGVSENTRKTIWKYLQLITMTVLSAVKDKSNFGSTADMFNGMDESELHEKLNEVMGGIGEFFSNMAQEQEDSAAESADNADDSASPNAGPNPFAGTGLPNADEIHGHLKGLFDGKIGTLAKELAEEIGNDFADIMGGGGADGTDGAGPKSTKEMLQKLMMNPGKMTDLVKTVSDKLDKKMKSGEISQEEMMKEATGIINKMKEMSGGNTEQFSEMFKTMAKGMGMSIPKNAKIDMNAMERMTATQSTRDKLRQRMEQKKSMQADKQAQEQAQFMQRMAEYQAAMNAAQAKQGAAVHQSAADAELTPFPELLNEPVSSAGTKKAKKGTNGKKGKK